MTTNRIPGASRASRLRPLILVFVIVTLAAGCSSSDGEISINDPWARPTAPGAENAAFYAQVQNQSGVDDELIGASSDRCTMTQIHNTEMNDGVMSMAPAEHADVTVGPSETLNLEPGGLHVMCMRVTEPLAEGEEIELDLEFRESGTISVTAVVEQR